MATVRVEVEVDADDVLFEVSTSDLLRQLRRRAVHGDREAAAALSPVLLEGGVGREPFDVSWDYACARSGRHPFLRVGAAS